ncbi:MAG TPA: hypothetical protein VGJ22_06470 [Anaerolineales bacterium]|jgi:hypothetical protein
MAESALAKKMKLKPGARAAIVNTPDGYLKELKPLPDKVQVVEKLDGQFDWIQLFVKTRAELESHLTKAVRALKPESILWISFPKGSSKIQTDLTRDTGWNILKTVDLKWVNLVSVNDIWSAFALRPYKPGEAKQDFR